MALQHASQIDDQTIELKYDDNGHEHIVTRQRKSDDTWQQEEFLNLDVHLDFSKSELSIFICQKLTQINNTKLIFREIISFSSTFQNPKYGINISDLYKNIISKISDISLTDYNSIIELLQKGNYIIKTGSKHFRSSPNYPSENIFDQVF